jgi:signal transduction histidine kinase
MEAAERERFDLAAVIAGCVEGYRVAYAPRQFEHQPPAQPLWVHGIPDAIAQMLDKLVENADDFAPDGTAIRVSLARRGAVAQLAVENDGPPLPEAARARLFESMVTVREGASSGEGAHLGLGLYIVRLVAEFHGGRVAALDGNGGTGVRFQVDIPAVT